MRFSGRFIKELGNRGCVLGTDAISEAWEEKHPQAGGSQKPRGAPSHLSAFLLAATSTRNTIRVRVSPADAQLSDPDGNPRGGGYHLGRNGALKAPWLMQAPEPHQPLHD